jgi:hypothetical protein
MPVKQNQRCTQMTGAFLRFRPLPCESQLTGSSMRGALGLASVPLCSFFSFLTALRLGAQSCRRLEQSAPSPPSPTPATDCLRGFTVCMGALVCVVRERCTRHSRHEPTRHSGPRRRVRCTDYCALCTAQHTRHAPRRARRPARRPALYRRTWRPWVQRPRARWW